MKLANHPTVRAYKEKRIDSPEPPAILQSAKLKQMALAAGADDAAMQGSQQMGPGSPYSRSTGALSKEDAGSIVKDYLASTRNPNLKLGEIKDAGNAFEAEIVTKDNSLVDRVLIDKTSGWMRPAY